MRVRRIQLLLEFHGEGEEDTPASGLFTIQHDDHLQSITYIYVNDWLRLQKQRILLTYYCTVALVGSIRKNLITIF